MSHLYEYQRLFLSKRTKKNSNKLVNKDENKPASKKCACLRGECECGNSFVVQTKTGEEKKNKLYATLDLIVINRWMVERV